MKTTLAVYLMHIIVVNEMSFLLKESKLVIKYYDSYPISPLRLELVYN